jgi:DNA repair photolyase
LAAIRELSAAGIPVRAMTAPIIPGLNDHEIPHLLEAAAEAGATTAAYVPLRLPWAVAPLFEAWLDRHIPGSKDKILNRVRDMRGGKLNDPNFGSRMSGEGMWAQHLRTVFGVSARKVGLVHESAPLSTVSFRVPTAQLDLFE